ncbi:hypothetical protein Q5O14_13000 [Eubacteriaceae bacterium ES2]|nr:hypothetical protein Q5O14_13000 [Eubacteriaceae bacterium ES2]
MIKISGWLSYLLMISLFLILLYWVEGGSWSSRAVAKYNDGYGTFDMKSYDVNTVEKVLSSMTPEGYRISYRYYVGDYLFTVVWGLLQCMISGSVYSSLNYSKNVTFVLFTLAIALPILRGIADIIENTLLVVTLKHFPIINTKIIETAAMATKIKLGSIKTWALLILVGVIMRIISIFKV